MNVLKRDNGSAMRATRFGAARVTSSSPAPIDPLATEVERLRGRVVALEQEIAAQAAAAETACAEAEARGRAAGRAAVVSNDQDRLDVLREGIAQALDALAERLARDHDVAVDIAESALTAMIGNAIPYRALVAATAARHAAALSHGTIVRLRVSAADFPDEMALALLPAFDREVETVVDPALAAGACRFELTLGALDASIPVQVAAITQVLDEARAA